MSSSRHGVHGSKSRHSPAIRKTVGKTNNRPNALYLEPSDVTFQSPTQKVSVFFDECNQEIITLTSGIGSKTEVAFQATDCSDKTKFLLPVEKRILSIKFNPCHTTLAYHVEKSNIEFMNVSVTKNANGSSHYEIEERRYVQTTRTRNSKLFGFIWAGRSELVMITDISIEYYHVEASRRRLRHIKSFQSPNNWFVYQPPINGSMSDRDQANSYSVLMTSTGSLGNSMQPYMFTRNQIVKLQRFDVEGNWFGNDKLELFERSITIASIYGSVRLLVLQHESLNVLSKGAQILIYTVNHESGLTTKTHTLDLDVSGRFAINILDNLVIAHDQPSKSSFIFDIMIESTEKSDSPNHFVSLVDSQPIRPLHIAGRERAIEMYSLNWVFFQPNYIIDAKMGLLSTLHLDLAAIRDLIQDNQMLLSFLALRKYSAVIILDRCREIVANSLVSATDPSEKVGSPLADVSAAFEVLSRLVISAPDIDKKSTIERQSNISSTQLPSRRTEPPSGVSIPQEDIQRAVFCQFEFSSRTGPAHSHFILSTLLEFVFFVRKQDKTVEFCIYEQLLECLIQNKRYYQLVQMIRSKIFEDSKQLACRLLSLRGQYRPAAQLGIDMLSRLNCLTDLIESLSLSPNPFMLHSETVSRLSTALHQSMDVR